MSQGKEHYIFFQWPLRSALILALMHAQTSIAATAPTAEQIRQEERAQRAFALQHHLNDLRRVERISYKLLRVSAPYCRDKQAESLGIPPITATDLPADLRQAFEEAGSASNAKSPRFHHVLSESPTALANVQEGDSLVSVSIEDRTAKTAERYAWTIERSVPSMTLPNLNAIHLTTKRDGQTRVAQINPIILCKLTPRLKKDPAPMAQLSGDVLTLTTGLLRELPEDDEVALILAQQIARWLLHPQLKDPAELQEKADYLSAFLVHNGGYSLGRAKNAWAKLAESASAKLAGSASVQSPSSARRALAFKAVQDEIHALQVAGKRVMPAQNRLPKAMDIHALAPVQAVASSDASLGQPAAQSEQDPRLYDLAAIPFIDEQGLTGYRRFLDSHLRPRAFVIGFNLSTQRLAWTYRFGPNAAADAIAQCELRLRTAPCYLYALDDQVVWNPSNGQYPPTRLSKSALQAPPASLPLASGYAPVSDVKAVPVQADELPNYLAFLDKPAPRAFVVLENGSGRYWLGNSALESALDFCEQSTQPCWLYAFNDSVVWHTDVSRRISRRSQLPDRAAEQDFLLK